MSYQVGSVFMFCSNQISHIISPSNDYHIEFICEIHMFCVCRPNFDSWPYPAPLALLLNRSGTGEDDRTDADLGIQPACRGFGSSQLMWDSANDIGSPSPSLRFMKLGITLELSIALELGRCLLWPPSYGWLMRWLIIGFTTQKTWYLKWSVWHV